MLGSLNKKLFGLLAIPLLWGQLSAQPLQELRRTSENYKSLKSFSVKLSVAFYRDAMDGKAAKTNQGNVLCMGNLSRSNYDGRETIIGNDFMLVADHGNQTVYYSPKAKTEKSPVSNGTELLDSSFLARYTITEKKIDDTYSDYKLSPKKPGGEISQMTIRINRVQHILSQIEYIYAREVSYKRVLIRYTDFNPSAGADKNLYTESKFIAGKQKTARLQPAYDSYKLINSFTYDPKKNLVEQ